MEVVIKAFLEETGAPAEVRRISIQGSDLGNKGIFKETFAKVGATFPGLANKIFTLKWKDSDGDLVMMSSDEEMIEALSQAQNSPLKIFVTVEGVKEASPDNPVDAPENVETDANQEASPDDKRESDHQREDPFTGVFESEFCDPRSFFGMRKRGHSDNHNPRGHFGFQFGNMGPRGRNFEHMSPRGHHARNMGPRGHHFGNKGPRSHPFENMRPRGHQVGHMGPRGHHFDHMGPRGHHFAQMGHRGHHVGNMGPRGHHFGHMDSRKKMHALFEGQDFLEGQELFNSFPGAETNYGHPGHHHNRHHHEEKGWKAKLREAVPVAHRRWAKAYIRTWRVQNLRNATSTSGDSDQEIVSMETASVPEAYAAWLDMFLPKGHISQGQTGENANVIKEKNPEEKSKLKASVPLEFRKWAKWYLARHFGRKEAPKFHKKVHFGKKMKKMRTADSDNSESENNGDWFKQAPWQLDGSAAPGLTREGATDSEQMSPHMYKWMAKAMMKKQKKMMRKEFKH